MDTGVIIAIVAAALILLAVLWFVGRKGRERRHETRRTQAREIRREAEVGSAQADRTRAEAEAQAAEAKRQDALARERSASADEQRREARERHIEAAKKDPDADPDEAAAQFDRERAQSGTAGTTGPTAARTDRDKSVEHYEHTDAPGMERERRFERNEEGEVVRDEEYEQPRTDR
jgi:F0F1-type ATP synthase membrane subunit b/b'